MEASALQKSMEMAMSKCMKESEGEQTTRKRQKKTVDWFVFLPDDILLDILKRVPDAFLRFRAKFVCRRWFNIITNRILLDHASYILQKMGSFTARLVDIREEGQVLQVKEQYLDIPHIGMIRSWCNEFLLISHYKEKKKSLYVYNLISKEGSYLPECDASCGGHYTSRKGGVALSFDGFKGIYKVAHLFIGRTIECHILTLKTDIITCASSKWKKIEVPYMNAGQRIIKSNPVSVQGRYINWRIYYSNDLVSVDMAKEEICIISLPGSSNRSEYFCYLFVKDGFLALFNSREKAEIWVLKDFRKVKWEKLLSITDSNTHFEVFYRYPRNVLRYRINGMISKRYIILKSIPGMYSYDLKYGVMKKLDIHIESNEHCVVHSPAPSLI